ncbi:hypothetical protein SFIMM107S_00779 [Streptomyces griseus]
MRRPVSAGGSGASVRPSVSAGGPGRPCGLPCPPVSEPRVRRWSGARSVAGAGRRRRRPLGVARNPAASSVRPKRRGEGGDAVRPLHRHRAQGSGPGRGRQCLGRRAQGGRLGVGRPGQEGLAATLHAGERQLTVDQDHQRPRFAARFVSGAVRGLRPRQGRAVRVGRVGGGEHQGLRRGVRMPRRSARWTPPAAGPPRRPSRTPGRPQPLDHIAAPRLPVVLEGGQHAVRRGEAALHPLGLYRAPGHHTVPVEEGAGQGVGTVGPFRFDRGEQRPAARDRRRAGAEDAGRAAAVSEP